MPLPGLSATLHYSNGSDLAFTVVLGIEPCHNHTVARADARGEMVLAANLQIGSETYERSRILSAEVLTAVGARLPEHFEVYE